MQVVLGLSQILAGHSLGGPLYFLGERTLIHGSPAVASGEFLGRLFLRPYSTFSHPNILAGWLLLSFLIILRLLPYLSTSRRRPLAILTAAITAAGLIFSASRVAIFSFFFLALPLHLIPQRRLPTYYLLLCAVTLTGLFVFAPPTLSDPSFQERLYLQQLSFTNFISHPIFGTGASASLSYYPSLPTSPRLLQPDHNSFTLFLSWFGLAGLFPIFLLRRPSRLVLSALLPLLPLLLFDHYLLTSPQGLFSFLLYLFLLTRSKG